MHTHLLQFNMLCLVASNSEDHGQGHVEGSNVVEGDEDDFCSCISDGQADGRDAC
jgi:hypothetical protein